MAATNRTVEQVEAALRMVEEAQGTKAEKSEMLMEVAMGMQQRPQFVTDIEAAVTLYKKAIEICPKDLPLLKARITARMGTALMTIPSQGTKPLEDARDALEFALGILTGGGSNEEVAEAEMNLGLVLQNLSGFHKARIQDSIGAYQRALRTFDKHLHPKEFAILQNNLATAFLSIPFSEEKGKMREALAVQAFEEGLSVITMIDHPSEYAMLQNNLGNALQYVSSSHRVENGYRAIEAYDEALKIRERRTAPSEYANTISNKANCLVNIPDDPNADELVNHNNTRIALNLYKEAFEIFNEIGELEKASAVTQAITEIQQHSGKNNNQLSNAN